MIFPTILLARAANMANSDVLTSSPLDLRQWTSASFWGNWTGSPTGTFVVQGSLDYGIAGSSATWVDLDIDISGQPTGLSGGNVMIDGIRTGLPYMRLKYTNSLGTGSLQIMGSAKGF